LHPDRHGFSGFNRYGQKQVFLCLQAANDETQEDPASAHVRCRVRAAATTVPSRFKMSQTSVALVSALATRVRSGVRAFFPIGFRQPNDLLWWSY